MQSKSNSNYKSVSDVENIQSFGRILTFICHSMNERRGILSKENIPQSPKQIKWTQIIRVCQILKIYAATDECLHLFAILWSKVGVFWAKKTYLKGLSKLSQLKL